MATDTTPPESPPIPSGRDPLAPLEPPGRAAFRRAWNEQRVALVVMMALSAVLVLVLIAIGERIAHRDQVLPGVEVGGVDVGGLDEHQALAAIKAIGARQAQTPLHVAAGEHVLSLDPRTIGYRVDAAATVRAARRDGRDANPANALPGVVLRSLRHDEVPLVVHYDPDALATALDGWVGATGKGLVDGGLRFDGTQVAEIAPRAGIGIDRDEAERRVLAALRGGSADLGVLSIGRTRPAIDHAEVIAAARQARRLLARPVHIVTGPHTLTLAPATLGSTLDTQIIGSRLVLRVDPDALRTALAPQLASVETAPKDATFAIDGQKVSVVPAVTGVQVGLRQAADRIARGSHRVTARLATTEPARTTAWAQKLNITELVASYTTQHPCCQPRVTNIHHAADTINGTIVEPGQTFSLNNALGPRTTAKGYVLAPGIGANLEFEDSVGGGVSQLSTTLFNAVFFGCYQDVTHTVHALYISRYPMGREATLNYPSIDNQFRNDSHSGVLIRTFYDGTSITVALYGNKEGRSCRAEGPHILQTIPIEPEYVDDPTLPVGTEKELSHGSIGYVVENFRIISRPGQPDVRQRFVERYSMAKVKIARGTGPPPSTTTTAPVVPPPPGA
ncbi:MAG: VanW family protein [Acidimicrobiia bacterium]